MGWGGGRKGRRRGKRRKEKAGGGERTVPPTSFSISGSLFATRSNRRHSLWDPEFVARPFGSVSGVKTPSWRGDCEPWRESRSGCPRSHMPGVCLERRGVCCRTSRSFFACWLLCPEPELCGVRIVAGLALDPPKSHTEPRALGEVSRHSQSECGVTPSPSQSHICTFLAEKACSLRRKSWERDFPAPSPPAPCPQLLSAPSAMQP